MGAAEIATCLSENEVLSLLRGSAVGGASDAARAHIDTCESCQALVACLFESGGVSGSGTPDREPHVSLVGRTIGRYRVERPIGAGAMGIVYLAEDPQLGRTVAVKVHRHQDTDASERLLREARSLARLSHPNIIVVHEVGTFEGNVFMAMEFVDGGSLTSWLAETERSTLAILDAFVQAGRGLAAAHSAGVVHRDFKPDNVLVGRDARVRVVDFGLARDSVFHAGDPVVTTAPERAFTPLALARTQPHGHTLTRTGSVVGTPAYMAPEQYAGQRADARSDQFAFAVALFEGLYGKRPFVADTFAELELAVTNGDVDVPRTSRRIPKPVTKALLRGLAPDPTNRHASMDAFLDALARPERTARTALTAAVLVAAGSAAAVFALRPTGPQITADVPMPTVAATTPAVSASALPEPAPTAAKPVASESAPSIQAASDARVAPSRSTRTKGKAARAPGASVSATPVTQTPSAPPPKAEERTSDLFNTLQ